MLTVFVMPHIPRWLWQSKNPDLQEIAIPLLKKQIKVGMRPDEVARLFGELAVPAMTGVEDRCFSGFTKFNNVN
jgi:hypothetical protein